MQQNYHQPKAYTPPREKDKLAPAPESKPVQEVTEQVPAEAVEEVKPVVGVVTDCIKLNVRSTPVDDSTGENVVATIDCLTEVNVDMKASTDRFYKIRTAAGIEGFCMRKYVAVRPQ